VGAKVVVVVGSENTNDVGNGVRDGNNNNEGVGGGEGNGTAIIAWSVVKLSSPVTTTTNGGVVTAFNPSKFPLLLLLPLPLFCFLF